MSNTSSQASSESRHIELDKLPTTASMLLRSLTTRKPKVSPDACFSPLSIAVKGVRAEAKQVARFESVCQLPKSEHLPLSLPHIMAFPMHLQLLLEPECPYSPMGAVHLRNRIRQYRPISKDECLELKAFFGEHRRVQKGQEIDIITEAYIDGALVWDDLSTMLIRKNGDPNAEKISSTAAPLHSPQQTSWELPSDLGRRYAKASGDYNPIHLWPLSAKTMGFKRHIIHGMWTKNRCLAALQPAQMPAFIEIDVQFKLPVFLPATLQFLSEGATAEAGEGQTQFEVRDAEGKKPHMRGHIRYEQGANPA